jgi:hypothetical protein
MTSPSVTLTSADAEFIRDAVQGDQVLDDAVRRHVLELLTEPSPATPDEVFPMVQRCCCNQPDDERVRFHRRGDPNLCRDAIEPKQ